MRSNPINHVDTFSYINNSAVQLDAVNAWGFILFFFTSPADHRSDIFFIFSTQCLTPLRS
jgi:hypothetical protein